MLPPTAATDGRDLPPPPASVESHAAETAGAESGTGSRSTGRSAKWALVGLSVVGLSYVAIVDPGRPNLVPGCAFKAVTGLDCPGCGGTRAAHALLHGDIGNAINHNVLATVAMVVTVVWLATNFVLRKFGREPIRFRMTTGWGIALAVLVGAFWILRNVPAWPLSWLGSGN